MKLRILKITGVVFGLVVAAIALSWSTRLGAQLRFPDRAHTPRVNSNFARLSSVVPKSNAKIIEYYEGLPHPFYDGDEFVSELWGSENRRICGYWFYKEQVEPPEEVRALVQRAFTSRNSFTRYGGPRLCGGYHADFAAKFESDGEHYWFLMCVGCGEVICQGGGTKVLCDLESDIFQEFRELWKRTYWAEQGVAAEPDRAGG